MEKRSVCYNENSLVVQWLSLWASNFWAQVQSAAGELRSEQPCGTLKQSIYIYICDMLKNM